MENTPTKKGKTLFAGVFFGYDFARKSFGKIWGRFRQVTGGAVYLGSANEGSG